MRAGQQEQQGASNNTEEQRMAFALNRCNTY